MRLQLFSLAAAATLVAAPGAFAQQDAAGIIAKHIEATGGAALWNGVTTSKSVTSATSNGMEIVQTETVKYGTGVRRDISVAGNDGYMIVTPKKSVWLMPVMGIATAQEMPEMMAKGMKASYEERNPLLGVEKGKATVKGNTDVGGRMCVKVEVTGRGEGTYYFDEATYQLLRRESIQEAMGQKIEITENYSDFQKTAYGLTVPMKVEQSAPGSPAGTIKVTSVEFNAQVDDKLFSTDI